ncbi:hypothetical protein AJ87_36895 [Rhizobium yanglingense]|nr:hypothetical protein AJ87_36895 [Rhizobium yanglingense]
MISALMVQGRCQLSDVAEAVGLHPRTLQRYLSESQEEYSDLLAEVRFETALRLMSDPSVRVIDVAYELGYTDPANFTRAFRHWTGLKPSGSVDRKLLRGRPAAARIPAIPEFLFCREMTGRTTTWSIALSQFLAA